MQSKKIDDEILNQGGDLGAITNTLMNSTPNNNYTILNKSMLPSKGLFYPQEIKYKKLTTIDIKNLSTVNSDTLDGVMNSVLSRNIININVNDIFVGDKIWLIFFLRSVTYNDYPYAIRYKCDNCGNSSIFNMRFNDLTIDYLKEDFNYSYKMDNNDVIEITFPTVGNEISCNQIIQEPEKYTMDGIIDEELLNIACYIKSVNGTKLSIMKAYDYITNLDGISFTNFSNYMSDVNFGVKPYININCECGGTTIVPLTFTSDYFMPKIK
mgnify:CR=1 FL=1